MQPKLKLRYQPGDKIGGRYKIHRVLMGGMGEVYLCRDLKSSERFALKTVKTRWRNNPKLRQAFEAEVGTWIALEKHPNIVRCFELRTLDYRPFIVLEWVTNDKNWGTDLRSWLRRGPLDLRLALDFTINICQGLIYADQKQPGLVHRDLKPDNILIGRGPVAKITDFGLAQVIQEAELVITKAESASSERQSLLSVGGVVGTPPYMPPEQWRGERLDARADIYAVGCILYEMLTGRWPFAAGTIKRFRHQHLNALIPNLPSDTWPQALDLVLTRCLAKQREERWATVGELLQEIVVIYQRQFAEKPRSVVVTEEFTAMDYLFRGMTHEKLERDDKALADYNHAIRLDPTLTGAYYCRGNVYYRLQRYDKAIEEYTRVIELDPTFNEAGAYHIRGFIYNELQRYEEALADFTRAIELNPESVLAYTSRALLYDNAQCYDEALTDYTQAIQLEPNNAHLYGIRGATYKHLARYYEALADFTRAVQLDPTDEFSYFERGVVYEFLQRYEEALADYTRTIELNPHHAKAYCYRGHVRSKLNHHMAQVIGDHFEAIALDPNLTASQLAVGFWYVKMAQWKMALYYFQQAAQLGSPTGAKAAAQVRQTLKKLSS